MFTRIKEICEDIWDWTVILFQTVCVILIAYYVIGNPFATTRSCAGYTVSGELVCDHETFRKSMADGTFDMTTFRFFTVKE